MLYTCILLRFQTRPPLMQPCQDPSIALLSMNASVHFYAGQIGQDERYQSKHFVLGDVHRELVWRIWISGDTRL